MAQDALVAAANAEVANAVAGVVRAMGVETAAGVLGLSKAEVRRVTKAGQCLQLIGQPNETLVVTHSGPGEVTLPSSPVKESCRGGMWGCAGGGPWGGWFLTRVVMTLERLTHSI